MRQQPDGCSLIVITKPPSRVKGSRLFAATALACSQHPHGYSNTAIWNAAKGSLFFGEHAPTAAS